jgi:hypothetical protein
VQHASTPNRAAHVRIGLGMSYIPARAVHADSIGRFWQASESIPEMSLVH